MAGDKHHMEQERKPGVTEDKHSMETKESVDTSSDQSSIPPPGNEETMAENIQARQLETTDELTHAKTNQSEAEPEYPTLKKLIPSVIALYLAFFLVALVGNILLNLHLHVHQQSHG